jgi:hypothetical protein
MDQLKPYLNKSIDELQSTLSRMPEAECKLKHVFTPGLYSRRLTMPVDAIIVSKIHKTEHQFEVSKGIACVKINDNEWEIIEAPYQGITKPGTRRVLVIVEECIWTTYHPTGVVPTGNSQEEIQDAVNKVEDIIIEKHELSVSILNSHLIENQ